MNESPYSPAQGYIAPNSCMGVTYIKIPEPRFCMYCNQLFPENSDGYFKNQKQEEFHFDCYIKHMVDEQVNKRMDDLIRELKK